MTGGVEGAERDRANGEEDDFYKETDLSRNEDDTDIIGWTKWC